MKNGIKLFLYCHLKILANKDDHPKCNRTILNGIVWIARSGAPWRDLPERYGPWQTVYSRFRKWMEDGILDNIFRVLSLDAELSELSPDASIVQAHQHSAGAKKGPSNEIGHSRGGASTKIHAIVDAYGYPVYVMLSEDSVMILITPSLC